MIASRNLFSRMLILGYNNSRVIAVCKWSLYSYMCEWYNHYNYNPNGHVILHVRTVFTVLVNITLLTQCKTGPLLKQGGTA